MAAGITNITGGPIGYCGAGRYQQTSSISALWITRTGFTNEGATGNPPWSREFAFDASRSSSIYGNSETVTPLSITVSFYLKY